MNIPLVLLSLLSLSCLTVFATDYYVDAERGKDDNAGTSVDAAWKSIDKVNEADLKHGDRVLFRKGGVWRGSLHVKSGAKDRPIVYTSYGEAKNPPALWQSVGLSNPKDWVPAGENLWKTRPDRVDAESRKAAPTFASNPWSVYCEGEAKADLKTEETADKKSLYRLTCTKAGRAGNQIQFTNSPFPVQAGQWVEYTFRARASRPFAMKNVMLMKAGSPWSAYGSVVRKGSNEKTLEFGADWQDYTLVFQPNTTANDGRITFFVGADIPEGCTFEFIPTGATSCRFDSLGLDADVGNLILTDVSGKQSAGWKRWSVAELKRQGDFFSDPLSPGAGPRTVHMSSDKNPAETYRSIEAALRHNIIDAGGQSWFVVDGIECAYTAAHGLAGPGIRNAIVRNCRFVWIGGGHLYTKGPVPTRYGNGIEFWCACEDNLVENCLFAHVYDTAMTNQGPDACTVRNMVWRKNRIEFCEQAYEIWLSSKDSNVEGLVYEGNQSYDCGFGWAHEQRPDKTATHLLAYALACKKLDITYRNNTFCRTQGAFIWYFNKRLPEITACDGNTYRQTGEKVEAMPLFRWVGQPAAGLTFEQFREKTGFEKNSKLEPAPKNP